MTKPRKYTQRTTVSQSGRLTLPRLLLDAVAANLAGQTVEVTIEDVAEKRTPNQMGYYFAGIVDPITDRFNELGERFSPDDVHEILKYKFLKVVVFSEDTGEVLVEYVRSTGSLKVYEMSFYMEDCIRYAATDLELSIDPPKVRRADYIFPIFPKTTEARPKYVARISGYLEDIFDIKHLERFFYQNDEWKDDVEIKSLFTKRKLEINKLRG